MLFISRTKNCLRVLMKVRDSQETVPSKISQKEQKLITGIKHLNKRTVDLVSVSLGTRALATMDSLRSQCKRLPIRMLGQRQLIWEQEIRFWVKLLKKTLFRWCQIVRKDSDRSLQSHILQRTQSQTHSLARFEFLQQTWTLRQANRKKNLPKYHRQRRCPSSRPLHHQASNRKNPEMANCNLSHTSHWKEKKRRPTKRKSRRRISSRS